MQFPSTHLAGSQHCVKGLSTRVSKVDAETKLNAKKIPKYLIWRSGGGDQARVGPSVHVERDNQQAALRVTSTHVWVSNHSSTPHQVKNGIAIRLNLPM